jgi:eukaryotic-like serine/threonine-protein kinase
VKVLDFGLVKETEKASPEITGTNAILGTPHYMAPEAIVDPANIDGRADLYALGASAYYLLTGKHVFDGTTLVEVCSQHLHQAPVPPSEKNADIPTALEEIVLACLGKKPDERPADAAALATRLRDCGVPAWTREDARAWWQGHAAKMRSGTRRRASSLGRSSAERLVLGNTVAVALDDRGPAS